MIKLTLVALAAYYALLSAFLIIFPHLFYETVPGVSATGPFNSHFTRDVGFAFLVCATGLILGALYVNRALALLGAAFPVLHGIFHVVAWGHHSFPSNGVAIMDLLATAGLATFTLFMATRLKAGAT